MKTLTEILLAIYALFMLVTSVGLSLTIPVLLLVANVTMASFLTIGLIRSKLTLIFIGVLGLVPASQLNRIAVSGVLHLPYLLTQMSFSIIILICAYKFLRKTSVEYH